MGGLSRGGAWPCCLGYLAGLAWGGEGTTKRATNPTSLELKANPRGFSQGRFSCERRPRSLRFLFKSSANKTNKTLLRAVTTPFPVRRLLGAQIRGTSFLRGPTGRPCTPTPPSALAGKATSRAVKQRPRVCVCEGRGDRPPLKRLSRHQGGGGSPFQVWSMGGGLLFPSATQKGCWVAARALVLFLQEGSRSTHGVCACVSKDCLGGKDSLAMGLEQPAAPAPMLCCLRPSHRCGQRASHAF